MKIKLWEKDIPYYNEEYGQMPTLEPFIVDGAKACILVIPGGGYHFVAYDHEGVEIAKKYNSLGFSAFVLNYRVAPYKNPVQPADIKRGMRYVRYLAKDYGYDSDKIGVIGFSAGGHAASMLLTLFDDGIEGDEIDKMSCRPNFGILSYPVIDLSENFIHRGSSNNLLGADATYEERKAFSSEHNVKENTPPTFIWTTAVDQIVPFKNSLVMAEALAAKGVPVEMHVFPEGAHGLGINEADPHYTRWVEMAHLFIKKYINI